MRAWIIGGALLVAATAVFLAQTDAQCPLDCPPPGLEVGQLPRGAALAFEAALVAGPPSPNPAGMLVVELPGFEPYVTTDDDGVIDVSDAHDRLLRSDDEGRSFLPLPPPIHEVGRSLGDVALLAADERLWYAKTLQSEGSTNGGLRLASSSDGGATWQEESPILDGAPDRPWLTEVGDALGLTWIDMETESTFARRLGGGTTVVGRGFGYGNVVATSHGLVTASCRNLFLEDVGAASYPRDLRARNSCDRRPMLAGDPATDRLDLAFVDDEGHVCVARSLDGGGSWERIVHCESARILGSEDKAPELWAVAHGAGTSVAWFEADSNDLALRVMRLSEEGVSLGVIPAGPIGPEDAPANTDFPALAALPDGRLVAAWSVTGGGTAVAVEVR